ncbi:hypothetical protein HOLleu_37198 [Holothuria leucospilota]|uniref:Sushi domain-containing protein n=1 Tax=Holothuria leucospilota TaxID=206669 RepID=A0A9Q0YLJ6_HOLLE|nr:hypothetical protein HOLleu_37198 [Holothuria leucospilota]
MVGHSTERNPIKNGLFYSNQCKWRRSSLLILAYLLFVEKLKTSNAQMSTIATTVVENTIGSQPTIEGCNDQTQCFLNETMRDPLIQCEFAPFGSTEPPCYGHWSSASSCVCNATSYRISSSGSTYWCNDNGKWDSSFYTLECLAPCMVDSAEEAISRNSNGVETSVIMDGDYVTYSCPDGYTSIGTAMVTCVDGTWGPHDIFYCTSK